jgi:2-oxoglutarate ferredoxin oxidoreductase subunit gamma
MRHIETVFSGFGGQGVLFAGQLLSYAGIADGLYVTWIPSYGPEMRGGTANCTVILSEEEIGAPVVRYPMAAVVMNGPSWLKYHPLVKADGLLLVNSSLVELEPKDKDDRVVSVPASDIATELGNIRMANMVLLGAFVEQTGIVSLDAVKQQLAEHLSERQRKWLEPNYAALDRGAQLVQTGA